MGGLRKCCVASEIDGLPVAGVRPQPASKDPASELRSNRTPMISDVLIPKLRNYFPSHGLQVGVPPDPCALFPAIHPEVGDIVISDEGYELTLEAGRFTHSHFSNYDQKLSEAQRAERISDDIVQFLDDLFGDRIVLWGSHDSRGGWYPRDEPRSEFRRGDGQLYVWSGPLNMGDMPTNHDPFQET
jgi:hypothetical protein